MSENPGEDAPTLLLLIRHAEQQTLREVDPPLSERGRRQAELLADRLVKSPIAAVVSSPMVRARQTAAPLAQRLGVEVEVIDDLAEAGTTPEEARHVFTNTDARFMEPDPDDYIGPSRAAIEVLPRFVWGRDGKSETGDQIRARMTASLDGLVSRYPGGIVACFSHGGAINAATGSWLGIPRDMWFVPWHTGITGLLAVGQTRTLLFTNDSSHLVQGEDTISVFAASVDRQI
jgi:broad specificity phosphatase PhoE